MKNLLKLLLFALTLYLGAAAQAQKEEVCYDPNLIKDTSKKSIKSVAEGKVGPAAFTINYHSPGVRKRIIWGGLVPFDEVWVTGAHDQRPSASTKTFSSTTSGSRPASMRCSPFPEKRSGL